MSLPVSSDSLDYDQLIATHPWIVERGQPCVISPDSDGFLCGLLMSSHLGWLVKGYYDGRILLLDQGLRPQDCVFLDMEIFRQEVRSIGQHMVGYRTDRLPPNWSNFDNCIQANNLRGFDFKNRFKEKYPFGTIHLLLSILSKRIDVAMRPESVGYLLYTDGTFKNIFNYPDNSLSWLSFLGVANAQDILHSVFYAEHTVIELMQHLERLFSDLRALNGGKAGADKMKFTKSNGTGVTVVDLEEYAGAYRIADAVQERNRRFLAMLAEVTGWDFIAEHWQYEGFRMQTFPTGEILPTQGRYFDLMAQEPISFAVTAGNRLEYTLPGDQAFL